MNSIYYPTKRCFKAASKHQLSIKNEYQSQVCDMFMLWLFVSPLILQTGRQKTRMCTYFDANTEWLGPCLVQVEINMVMNKVMKDVL